MIKKNQQIKEQKRGMWEEPERPYDYEWEMQRYFGKSEKSLFIKIGDEKIYYQEYKDIYIKIVGSGQIIKKKNFKKFYNKLIKEAFIENI